MKQVAMSSHVEAIGYDAKNQTLHVQYKGGNRVVYSGVPPEKYDAINKSWSVGQALHELIKNKHPHSYLK